MLTWTQQQQGDTTALFIQFFISEERQLTDFLHSFQLQKK